MKKGRVLFCLLVLLSACMLFACEPQKTEQSLSVFLYGEQQLILPDGNENIRWMSADTATVTVSADGMIKGIAPGTADRNEKRSRDCSFSHHRCAYRRPENRNRAGDVGTGARRYCRGKMVAVSCRCKRISNPMGIWQ